jgi:hypothetical protein
LTRNRLYGLLALLCTGGYAWVYYNLTRAAENELYTCTFKKIAGIPCPSCGSTRSVISLMQGDLVQAVIWNPMGLALMISMALIPVWIVYDLFNKKRTLFIAFRKAELFFSRKRFAIPALLLLVANWIWNIYKGV